MQLSRPHVREKNPVLLPLYYFDDLPSEEEQRGPDRTGFGAAMAAIQGGLPQG